MCTALITIAERARLSRAVNRTNERGEKKEEKGRVREREREHAIARMIIIELSGRRLMTLVTLPMAKSRQSTSRRNRDLACNTGRAGQPVDEDDAFYISGERCFQKGTTGREKVNFTFTLL